MKKICILGGGHGTSRLIKGFKGSDNLVDVIVTTSDNGGHSHQITKEFNLPALGDLRMILESLLTESLAHYFSYRFKTLHAQENVSLGNLILLSIVLENDGNIDEMMKIINRKIDKNFTLHLAAKNVLELEAISKDGKVISGETNIGCSNNIQDVYLKSEPIVDDETLASIRNADIVVLSFGSFYTSLGAVICNEKILQELKKTKAKIIYLPNLVNQKETENYYLEDYVNYVENKLERKIDRVIVSNTRIKRKTLRRYKKQEKQIVTSKEKRDNYEYYSLSVIENDVLRHNEDALAKIIIE